MEGQRIDELARRLGGGTSRRQVLRGIAAGIGASVFGIGMRRAPSAGATALPPCNPDNTCNQPGAVCTLEGVCDPDAACGRIVGCPTGYYCDNSFCVFPCAETGTHCAADEDCCDELVCTNGACAESDACFGAGDPCASADDCCTGDCVNGVCDDADACAHYDAACSFPEVTVAASIDGSNCCEGQCLEGICVPWCIGDGGDCADDDDCCTGLACVDGACLTAEVCGVFGDACEMIEDHGCCAGLTCFEGQCDNPSGLCTNEWEYCDGTNVVCCSGLVCGNDDACHAEGGKPEEPKPHPQGPTVTTLPGTGSGTDDDGSGWINAAALGGAAAVLGGALLRKHRDEREGEPEQA